MQTYKGTVQNRNNNCQTSFRLKPTLYVREAKSIVFPPPLPRYVTHWCLHTKCKSFPEPLVDGDFKRGIRYLTEV